MISDKRIDVIDSLIANSLNEENVQSPPRVREMLLPPFRPFETASKTGIGAVTVRAFAVKVGASRVHVRSVPLAENPEANFNRLLDVARETFKENVADIYQLGRELSEAHGLPLVLVYQGNGFIFQLKKSEVDGELPGEFINVTEKKGRVVFSTLDLVRLSMDIRDHPYFSTQHCSSTIKKKRNARMKDALDEVMSLSDKLFTQPHVRSRNILTRFSRIIRDLVDSIVSHIGALYKASEAVSLVWVW